MTYPIIQRELTIHLHNNKEFGLPPAKEIDKRYDIQSFPKGGADAIPDILTPGQQKKAIRG